jgi:arabinose-5-phosphate isomerase
VSKENASLVKTARTAMESEARAITKAAAKLDQTFVDLAANCMALSGKIVITGLGKSGHVAHKLAATLASTGSPSFYMHPSEALHGDLGMISPTDLLLAIAFGGETVEVIEVAKHAKRIGCKVAAITGKPESSLGRIADYCLDGSIDQEVCPLNLAPTASTAVAMALGDALAVVLMELRGFSAVDFASLHPGGTLGKKLSTVKDHMRQLQGDSTCVSEDANFHDVLTAVTKFNFGIVPVLNKNGILAGAISDGDIRRSLQSLGAKALEKKAKDILTAKPKTIASDRLAIDAFNLMEKNQITSLFVVEPGLKNLVGIVRMHDLLAAKIV